MREKLLEDRENLQSKKTLFPVPRVCGWKRTVLKSSKTLRNTKYF